jgi:hypothetical protein
VVILGYVYSRNRNALAGLAGLQPVPVEDEELVEVDSR